MASMLPNTPLGLLAPEKLRVFRLLKQLPDSFVVWQRLAMGQTGTDAGPDFWVRREDGRCALLTVSAATLAEVRQARQEALFAPASRPGAAEEEALARFWIASCLSETVGPQKLVPGLVLFPAVPEADLELALAPAPADMSRGAKENLTPAALAAWLDTKLGPPLSAVQLDTLRRAFTPEVIVPAQLTVCKPIERATAVALSDYLLSYNQEQVLKHDLDLSDEAEAASDNLRLQLVNGVAGSGKSLILLYRARLLRQFFPRKRLLVLTHNRPLMHDLKRRYELLSGDDRGVEWRTFHGWCAKYWPTSEPAPQRIGLGARRTLIERIWQQHLADTTFSSELLRSEIDWLKDRLITTRQGYLAADRAGRGVALREGMRGRVYDAIHAYQEELQQRGLVDFGDVPRRIWRALLEVPASFPRYDVVLIDEGQFFAPIWFEIVKRVLAPEHGQLFIVADPTQGFLKRRQSWLASGLNVRGHSQRLEKCYRTTREILAFATRFYQLRLPGDDEAHIAANVELTPDGLPPEVLALRSEQDELLRVVNELRALVDAGVKLEHILVIHADWQGAQRALERLQMEFGAARVVHPKEGADDDRIRVCQIDSATGLESRSSFCSAPTGC
ncbi:ATP-dependent helicase [Candidatus Gracilibacteria bacterium]|nr:ATP-dependent helicase [Candidatus Gracilibacteria bacterium]